MYPSESEPPSSRKFFIFLSLVIGVLLMVKFGPLGTWLERERLRHLFAAIAATPWAPAAFVGSLCLALSVGLPVTPFALVGGVVFGLWPGVLYNWLGTTLGATSAFLIARYVGREFLQHRIGGRLRRMDEAISRNGFWAIFTMRLIPLIPFNLSNFAAGLTRVELHHYVAATGLAIVPGMTIFTYFSHSLWTGTDGGAAYYHLLAASVLLLLMATLPWLHQRRMARDVSRG